MAKQATTGQDTFGSFEGAHDDGIVTRYTDGFVVGFQYQTEAGGFLQALRWGLVKFKLELRPILASNMRPSPDSAGGDSATEERAKRLTRWSERDS